VGQIETAAMLLRGSHMVALLSLFGCLVFGSFVVPREAAGAPLAAVNRIASVSAWLALLLGCAWMGAVAGTIAGAESVGTLLAAIPAVVRHTSFGNLACVRSLLLIAVLPLLVSRNHRARNAALLAAGCAIALQPLHGHIGAADGRDVLIPIEIAHLLAAGAWFGCLAPLLVCVIRTPAPMAAALCERFTPVGLVAVGTIAVTALPQAGALIGGIPGLLGTQYGRLALLKFGLFCLSLVLACVNRLVLTARLGTSPDRRALIGSIAIEVLALFCVVMAAGAMASTVPATHTQPVWPFPWRPSLEVWAEPGLRAELERLMIATAGGFLLVCASLAMRHFRILALISAVLVIAPFTPALELLLVEAYPTSYARSTTGFSVNAIARGQALFGERCAVCHEPLTGTRGAADLTASHIWGHLDGELFWWITDGVRDFEGSALMPAFGSVLSEDDRWALIDFIRARNVGRQNALTGHWSPPVPAPATPLSCAGNDADTLADLTMRVAVVVVEGGPATSQYAEENLSDSVTIRLSQDAAARPKQGECVAASADAWEAWRIVSGLAPDRFGGSRAIVDGQGWLRAWLLPGAGSDAVLAAVRDARAHPLSAAALAGGHHH
jgi:putative copper export protein/mono/diheme cytochrome c family protein